MADGMLRLFSELNFLNLWLKIRGKSKIWELYIYFNFFGVFWEVVLDISFYWVFLIYFVF